MWNNPSISMDKPHTLLQKKRKAKKYGLESARNLARGQKVTEQRSEANISTHMTASAKLPQLKLPNFLLYQFSSNMKFYSQVSVIENCAETGASWNKKCLKGYYNSLKTNLISLVKKNVAFWRLNCPSFFWIKFRTLDNFLPTHLERQFQYLVSKETGISSKIAIKMVLKGWKRNF